MSAPGPARRTGGAQPGAQAAVARQSITLVAERCTSCMICVRECPTWCISIQAHQELDDPAARRPRVTNVLDSFTLDWGLCMFCGICVDVCPFDALHWDDSPVVAATERGGLVAKLGPGSHVQPRRP